MTQERTLTLKASFSVKGRLVVIGNQDGGVGDLILRKVDNPDISDNPDFRQLVSL